MILPFCRVCGSGPLSEWTLMDSDAMTEEGFGPAWFFCCRCAKGVVRAQDPEEPVSDFGDYPQGDA